MFMTFIFRHRDLLIIKIYQFKRIETERERESVCMCLVCVLHKLIILSKFVTEKEKQKTTNQPIHLHYSKIIVFVVLLSFCVILT